jgi:hypothetical protein
VGKNNKIYTVGYLKKKRYVLTVAQEMEVITKIQRDVMAMDFKKKICHYRKYAAKQSSRYSDFYLIFGYSK